MEKSFSKQKTTVANKVTKDKVKEAQEKMAEAKKALADECTEKLNAVIKEINELGCDVVPYGSFQGNQCKTQLAVLAR